MEKNDIREQLIAKLEELLGEENAAEAFLRAKDLKRSNWDDINSS